MENNEKISLTLVETTSDDLADALGITGKRRDELCENIFAAHEKEGLDLPHQMQEIAGKTNNHTELAWSMLILGTKVGDSNDPFVALKANLGEVLRNVDLDGDDDVD